MKSVLQNSCSKPVHRAGRRLKPTARHRHRSQVSPCDRNQSLQCRSEVGLGATLPACPTLDVHLPSDPLTVVEVTANVGQGNTLYIRGQGEGLSWEKGQALNRGFGGHWIWTSRKAKGMVIFKLLLNDTVWAKGDGLAVAAGKMIEVAPAF